MARTSARRMMCTRCGVTDLPNTVIGGSDLLELLGWLSLLLPGALYCYWRHLSRRKVCSHCGSFDLIRESRAARARNADPRQGTLGGKLIFAARPVPGFGPPGRRLRLAKLGAATASVLLVAWGFAAVDVVGVLRVPPPSQPAVGTGEEPDDAESLRALVRRRECEKLCSEFHRARNHGHRECMSGCLDRFSVAPEGEEAVDDTCGDLLDPTACDFVVGQ